MRGPVAYSVGTGRRNKGLKVFSRGKTWFNAAFSGSQNDIHPRPHFRRPAADQRCGRGDPYELAGDGLFISHDERYEATDEFLTVWRRLLQGETVSYEGKHIKVENSNLLFPPQQEPHPPIYFGGSSQAGIEAAAKHTDVYLTWGEPPEQVKEKIERVKKQAAKEGDPFDLALGCMSLPVKLNKRHGKRQSA